MLQLRGHQSLHPNPIPYLNNNSAISTSVVVLKRNMYEKVVRLVYEYAFLVDA